MWEGWLRIRPISGSEPLKGASWVFDALAAMRAWASLKVLFMGYGAGIALAISASTLCAAGIAAGRALTR